MNKNFPYILLFSAAKGDDKDDYMLQLATEELFSKFQSIAGNEFTTEDEMNWFLELTSKYTHNTDYILTVLDKAEAEEVAPKPKQQLTVQQFKAKLSSDYAWMERGLIRLFEAQTEDEQNNEATSHKNGVGFNGTDAAILSSFAKQVKRGRKLSTKQQAIAFKKMPKYARQLHKIAYP